MNRRSLPGCAVDPLVSDHLGRCSGQRSLLFVVRHSLPYVLTLCLCLPAVLAQVETLAEVDKVTASNAAMGDAFSRSVALDGDVLAVGADLSDVVALSSGAVYVYERTASGRFVQVAQLAPSGLREEDYFGVSVSLSGGLLAVGAEGDDQLAQNAGAAYLFERQSDGAWTERQRLVSSSGSARDFFGHAVSISGNRLAVGAFEKAGGSVYIFEPDEKGFWTETSEIVNPKAPEGVFGFSLALDGSRLVVGDYTSGLSGTAYVYQQDLDGGWQQMAELVPSQDPSGSQFGWSVALHDSRAVVGAWGDDSFGPDSGLAYVYELNELDLWSEVATLHAAEPEPGDRFGYAVSLLGDHSVIGSYLSDEELVNSGSVSLFRRSLVGEWLPSLELVASDRQPEDRFGFSIALGEGRFVVGALEEDSAELEAGAAYVFDTIAIDPLLEVRGQCPGEISIVTTGVTPRAPISVSGARQLGQFELLGGPCAGLRLNLNNPSRLISQTTGYDRTSSLVRAASQDQCGGFLQVIDERTCTVSAVARVPEAMP